MEHLMKDPSANLPLQPNAAARVLYLSRLERVAVNHKVAGSFPAGNGFFGRLTLCLKSHPVSSLMQVLRLLTRGLRVRDIPPNHIDLEAMLQLCHVKWKSTHSHMRFRFHRLLTLGNATNYMADAGSKSLTESLDDAVVGSSLDTARKLSRKAYCHDPNQRMTQNILNVPMDCRAHATWERGDGAKVFD